MNFSHIFILHMTFETYIFNHELCICSKFSLKLKSGSRKTDVSLNMPHVCNTSLIKTTWHINDVVLIMCFSHNFFPTSSPPPSCCRNASRLLPPPPPTITFSVVSVKSPAGNTRPASTKPRRVTRYSVGSARSV